MHSADTKVRQKCVHSKFTVFQCVWPKDSSQPILHINTRVCCKLTCSCSGKLCSVPSIIGIRLPKASRWVWSGVEDSSEIVVGEILYNARAFYSASRVFGDPNQLPCRRDRLHQNTSKIRRNTWLSPQTRGNSRSAATLFQTCVQSKCI